MKSRAVCILGMHRSGTSAVSRTINLMGAYLGEESDLMPAHAQNPEGFWERNDIVEFHERLLHVLGRKWDSVLPLPEGWLGFPTVIPFKEELKLFVSKHMADKQLWAWKDPRTCVFLPLWKEVLSELGIELLCVLALRHPIDVAKSLEKRNNFTREKSIGIWFSNIVTALNALSDVPTYFLSYDSLLNETDKQIDRLISFLDMENDLDRSALDEQLKTFLQPELKHSKTQEIETGLSGQVSSLYNDICLTLEKKGVLVSDLIEMAGALDTDLRFFTNAIAEDWDSNVNTINILTEIVAARDMKISEIEKQLNQRNLELLEKDKHLHHRNLDVQERDHKLSEKDQQLSEVDLAYSQRVQKIAEHGNQILEQQVQLEKIINSRSWRLTLPLRLTGQLLRKVKGFLKQTTENKSGTTLPEIKTPLHFNIEASSLQSGSATSLSIAGWCFSTDSLHPVELQIKCGTKIVSEFSCDVLREDVSSAFSPENQDGSSLPNCGFEHWINLPDDFKTAELYSPQHNRVLERFSSKDIVAAESGWLIGQGGGSGNKNRLQALRVIAHKARSKINKDTILSLDNWKIWLRHAREELRHHRNMTVAPTPDGTLMSAADAFIEKNRIKPHVREILEKAVDSFKYRPTISLIMPVYNVERQFLEEAIASVQDQIYPNWELCLADDASTLAETKEVLAAQDDPRIKIVYRSENGHICKASNDAAQQTTGDFIALMDNDDLLAPHALFEIVRLLQKQPDADLIYSDEDKVDVDGKHFDLHFKPDWSPALLLGYNYINHLTCIRRSLFEEVGRFRPGYEGAQDYDLLLRVTEETDRVFHIPKVLYHWRAIPGSTALSAEEKPIVGTSAYRILQEALERRVIVADIYQPEFARKINVPVQQLEFVDDGPSVELIIPTYNKWDILKTCIDSIQKKTTYRNYKIMIVDNDSREQSTLNYLEKLKSEGLRVEHIPNDAQGFSFSRINNIAVDRSDAELVLFLNNDTEVIDPQWLNRMVGYLQLPGVGSTGARLIYPDDTIQHAGVILGMGGGFIPDHAFCHMSKDLPGYFFLPGTSHECSAVTAACLLTRRETFLAVGGFDEQDFRVSLNDVDLCMKIQGAGLRNVYVAGAELYHHESLTRSKNDDPAELANFRDKHGGGHDPYYSPNLSRTQNYAILPECTLDYADLLGRKLKVVFFSHNLNYEGAPNILFDVARGLKEKGTVDPIIISPCDGPQREALEQGGLEVQIVPVRKEDNVLLGWASKGALEQSISVVKDYLQLIAPDVVVTNVVNTYFVVNAAHNAQIPCVWWIHESYDQTLLKKHIQALAMPTYEAAFKNASASLFVSRDTSDLYRQYNSKHNFQIIHNSLDTTKINALVSVESKKAAKEALGIDEGKKVIVCVGTVCDRKDQGTLVEAVNLLGKERDDFVCYIVGFRPSLSYGKLVASRVEEFGIDHLVKLVPETKEVDKYYLAADIFTFTSLNESYSLTILEAMAFGLPIVTTKCFGVPEQVRFDTNALAIDFGDYRYLARKLTDLLDNSEMRKRFGRNSKEMMRYMQTREEMLGKHEHLDFSAFQEGLNQ